MMNFITKIYIYCKKIEKKLEYIFSCIDMKVFFNCLKYIATSYLFFEIYVVFYKRSGWQFIITKLLY